MCITHTQTPLHLAATIGYSNCLQVLLKYGARSDIRDFRRDTPLDLAIVHEKIQCKKILMEWQKQGIECKACSLSCVLMYMHIHTCIHTCMHMWQS